MERVSIFWVVVALVIVFIIYKCLAALKFTAKYQIDSVFETDNRHYDKGSCQVLFIVRYKDGHTKEEWVDIADYKYEQYQYWNANKNEDKDQGWNQDWNQNNPEMKIKLCRIFNLFRTKSIIYSLLGLFVTLIMGFIERNFWWVLLTPVLSVCYCFNYSKFLKVDNQTVKYRVFRAYRRRYGSLSREIYGKYGHIYREVTGKAETVEFRQNIIEKLFNAGHISFIEEETSHKHYVYGIRHFDVKKQEIERIFREIYF